MQTSPMRNKSLIFSEEKSKKQKNTQKNKSEAIAYIQDELNITQVYGGYIFMGNGTIVGVQEILPVNFFQKSEVGKELIYNCLVRLSRVLPSQFQFKTRSEKIDVSRIIQNINESTKDITDKTFIENKEDYIRYIKNLQSSGTYMRRYYVIWDYEGNAEGEYSDNVDEIVKQMQLIRKTLIRVLKEGGVSCYKPKDENIAVCEFMYKFFNPLSSEEEPFTDRIKRLNIDATKYSKSVHHKYDVYEEDYIAPRGVTVKPNFVIMDGMYYTFLTLTDMGHPEKAFVGWLNHINGMNYDVDVICRQRNKAKAIKLLKEVNKVGQIAEYQEKDDINKLPEVLRRNKNRYRLYNTLQFHSDEQIYDVMVLISVHGKTFKEMEDAKDILIAHLNSNSLQTMDSWIISYPCLKMTMPFMWVDEAIFVRNKHNYLSSSLASLFTAISENIFDERGLVIGANEETSEIISLDLFNTDRLNNANMLITGAPGSGKTFTELMVAGRMLLSGMNTYFVLPAKSYEYERAIKAWGGSYYPLYPGSDIGLNPMAIYPEAQIQDEAKEFKPVKISLLTRKTNFLTAFIQALNLGERLSKAEKQLLEIAIADVYRRFGITSDNDSIWRDTEKQVLKDMPILEDLYDTAMSMSGLENVCDTLRPFIDGAFSNFNSQTTIPLNNRCIAFDTDVLAIGQDYMPAITYLAYDTLSNLMRSNNTKRKAMFVDEAWVLIKDELTASQITETARLIRGYYGSIIIASQHLNDFNTPAGATIIDDTALKLFLKMGENDLNALRKIMPRLTDDEFDDIAAIQKKHGILKSSEQFIKVWLLATSKEERLYTTDGNIRERIIKENQRA